METNAFLAKENLCQLRFGRNAEYYHLCTSEKQTLIFTDDELFEVGISLLGICAKMFPGIKLYTFQLMGNHLHGVVSGNREEILDMFGCFKAFLTRYLKGIGRYDNLEHFKAEMFEINTLENLRNAIAYVNRNGAAVNPDETPFSYRWGANYLFYNREAKSRYMEKRRPFRQSAIQALTHSRKCDGIDDLFLVDGYASPMSFCEINETEGFFRDARHYFYSVAKNIESYKEIAELIGETTCLTDQDLFSVVCSVSRKEYGCDSVDLLSLDAKRALAIRLHKDYHASNKQIQRLLKLSQYAVDTMFPLSAKR